MALVKTYWDGEGRQRAVSMWSIGSWGGSGLAALFGGFVASTFNWRAIFYVSIVVSVIAIALDVGHAREPGRAAPHKRFDVVGLGHLHGLRARPDDRAHLRPAAGLGPAADAWLLGGDRGRRTGGLLLLRARPRRTRSSTSGCSRTRRSPARRISNFVLNGTIGLLIVSQQMLQIARPELFDPWKAGLLTIGYAVAIIAFIRVGEKLLRRFGPRKPMIWGAMIVALSCLLLMPTNLLVGQYTVLAVIAYTALRHRPGLLRHPVDRCGAVQPAPGGRPAPAPGIYKMASSLGSAIGAALSLTIFSSFLGGGVTIVGELLHTQGIQSNAAVRQAGW